MANCSRTVEEMCDTCKNILLSWAEETCDMETVDNTKIAS